MSVCEDSLTTSQFTIFPTRNFFFLTTSSKIQIKNDHLAFLLKSMKNFNDLIYFQSIKSI